ncbi:MAG: hypothetical protein RMJ43_10285, partial [Chloroherpetonaceae bacterium]|nr:hypothetical protein [Chthonomonadaceae bacterium]MDW8208216.1 hypothetical protein [Chloroherpetonaceae bacterium]
MRSVSVLLGVLLLTATPIGAQRRIAPAEWTIIRSAEQDLNVGVVRAGGQREALRLTVSRPVQPFYQSAISYTLPEDVSEGMRVRLRFRARSATRNPLRAVVEKNGPPFTAVVEASPVLEPVWKEFVLTGTSPGYGAGGLAVRFQVGHQAGIIELAEVTLQVLGRDPELEAARAAVAPEAVQERIARHRKGRLLIRVLDA